MVVSWEGRRDEGVVGGRKGQLGGGKVSEVR